MTWEDVIARYALPMRRQGSQWRGPCPLHKGSNATAFVITPDQGFHCFSCGAGGGISQFIRLMGDEPDSGEHSAAFRSRPKETRSAPVVPLAPLDSTHPYFGERGIQEATARYFGMGYFNGLPPLGRRIIAPLHDPAGQLVGHLGRAVDDRIEPRYCFQRGVRRNELLFNLHRVKATSAESVILVEGVFDALAVYQIGFSNVVASLGCQVTEHQRALLRRFSRVLILFDDDAAGTTSASHLEAEFQSAAVRLHLPKADPASIKGVLLDRIIRAAG